MHKDFRVVKNSEAAWILIRRYQISVLRYSLSPSNTSENKAAKAMNHTARQALYKALLKSDVVRKGFVVRKLHANEKAWRILNARSR